MAQVVSARYLEAWRGGGQRRHRVLLDQGDGVGLLEVPHTIFRVDGKRGDRVVSRYSGSVTLTPDAPVVNAYGGRVRCQAGFLIDDAVEWCTLATLRVEDVDEATTGGQLVNGFSSERAVEVAGFESPVVIAAGSGIAAILSLLSVVPVNVRVDTLRDHTAAGSVWETTQSRWDAVLSYAQALSVDVYADANGDFVIADIPTLANPPVVTVDVGGVKTGHLRKRSRTGVPSVVVVEGNRTNTATAPPRGVARDGNPLSPTYYLGPFGRQQKNVNSPIMLTNEQCGFAAVTILAQTQGLARSLTVTSIPMDFLEPGDVITAEFADSPPEVHIVDALNHTSDDSPPKGQTLTTRMLGGGS